LLRVVFLDVVAKVKLFYQLATQQQFFFSVQEPISNTTMSQQANNVTVQNFYLTITNGNETQATKIETTINNFIDGNAPNLLVLTGVAGSGKSTLAKFIREAIKHKYSIGDQDAHRIGVVGHSSFAGFMKNFKWETDGARYAFFFEFRNDKDSVSIVRKLLENNYHVLISTNQIQDVQDFTDKIQDAGAVSTRAHEREPV
jgi:hypothetical protein